VPSAQLSNDHPCLGAAFREPMDREALGNDIHIEKKQYAVSKLNGDSLPGCRPTGPRDSDHINYLPAFLH